MHLSRDEKKSVRGLATRRARALAARLAGAKPVGSVGGKAANDDERVTPAVHAASRDTPARALDAAMADDGEGSLPKGTRWKGDGASTTPTRVVVGFSRTRPWRIERPRSPGLSTRDTVHSHRPTDHQLTAISLICRTVTIAATVAKMISERLPPGLKMSAEVKEMVLEACNEFVQCVASEANEISTKENKTTIMPEHVVNALKSLDFEAYVERVSAAAEEMKEEGKEARAEKKKKKGMQMSPEEALALQEKMFAEARARYNSGDASGAGGAPGGGAPPPPPAHAGGSLD